MKHTTTIEVYADISCPFTHIGLRTILRRRNELGRDDVSVRVRSWPLEPVNGVPFSVSPLPPMSRNCASRDLAARVDFPSGVRITSLANPMPFDGALAIDSEGHVWRSLPQRQR